MKQKFHQDPRRTEKCRSLLSALTIKWYLESDMMSANMREQRPQVSR